MQNQLTTIPITKDTRDELKKIGSKGETYDHLIRWMIEKIEYDQFLEVQYDRLKEKDKFVSLDDI